MLLRPGLSSIREKLRLASTRQTTLVEDAAYSLLGIFSAAGISAIYGEGEGALGRLLANVLTRSGDVSILAWTGESGPFNSCLPAYINVFKGPTTSHLPLPIPDDEMEAMLPNTSSNLDVAQKLYDRLSALSAPRFAESRMTLSCIAIRLPRLSSSREGSLRIHRADTPAFWTVEIRTRQDLSRMGTLYLVHPWLESLLEHADVQSAAFDDNVAPISPCTDDDELSDADDKELDRESSLLDPSLASSRATPDQAVPIDCETRARRLVARLRRPFGVLLLSLTAAGQRVVGYKRVAADSLIRVQFLEEFSLEDVLKGVRTFDVL